MYLGGQNFVKCAGSDIHVVGALVGVAGSGTLTVGALVGGAVTTRAGGVGTASSTFWSFNSSMTLGAASELPRL